MGYKNLCCDAKIPLSQLIMHSVWKPHHFLVALLVNRCRTPSLWPNKIHRHPLFVFPLPGQKEALLVYKESSAIKLHCTQAFNLCLRSFWVLLEYWVFRKECQNNLSLFFCFLHCIICPLTWRVLTGLAAWTGSSENVKKLNYSGKKQKTRYNFRYYTVKQR